MLPLTENFDNLHQILRILYEKMIPLCSDLIGVSKGVAGFGALFYIAVRVWQALSRAEPIDIYPLLRPFAIGLCIMFFPTIVLETMNNVLNPIVTGTHKLVESQSFDMNNYRQQKDELETEAMRRNPESAWLVDNAAYDQKLIEMGIGDEPNIAGMFTDLVAYGFKKLLLDFAREILDLLFQAAALVIDTIRTFYLIVLAILGPLAFAVSVFDGFQATLTQWIARYVSVYLWLAVSDLFSAVLAKLQVLMIQKDIDQLSNLNFIPDGSSSMYIVFMIIGIIGYFTVPTVANWIIQSGGMGSSTGAINKAGTYAAGATGSAAGNVAGRLMGK